MWRLNSNTILPIAFHPRSSAFEIFSVTARTRMKRRERGEGEGPLKTWSTLARYRGRKIGVQVARVFRSGYFNGVIMYVCFTTSDRSLLDYTCNLYSRLYGAHGRLGRVRPSMGPPRYIQSRNYHFCTALALASASPVLYHPRRVPFRVTVNSLLGVN